MQTDQLPSAIISKINLIENSTMGLGICLNLKKLLLELEKQSGDSERLTTNYKGILCQHNDWIRGIRQLKERVYDWIEHCSNELKQIDSKHHGIVKAILIKAEGILKGRIIFPMSFSFDGLENLAFERIPLYEILLQMMWSAVDVFASWGVFQELEQFATFEIVRECRQFEKTFDLIPDVRNRCEIPQNSKRGKLLAKMLGHGFIKAAICPSDPRFHLPKSYEIEYGLILSGKDLPKFVQELRKIEDRRSRLEMLDTQPEILLNDLLFYSQMGEMIEEHKKMWVPLRSFPEVDSSLHLGRSPIEIDAFYENHFLRHFAWKVSKNENFKVLHNEIIRTVKSFLLHLLDRSEKLDPHEIRTQTSNDDERYAFHELKTHIEKMPEAKRKNFSNSDAQKHIKAKANEQGRHFNSNATTRACKLLRKETHWVTKPGPKSG